MPTNGPSECPACHVIDEADGVLDGNLFQTKHYKTHTTHTARRVLRAQARAADQISS